MLVQLIDGWMGGWMGRSGYHRAGQWHLSAAVRDGTLMGGWGELNSWTLEFVESFMERMIAVVHNVLPFWSNSNLGNLLQRARLQSGHRLALLDKSIPFVGASVFSHGPHPHKGKEMTSWAPPAGDKRVCRRAPLKDSSMCQNIWHLISNEHCRRSRSRGAALSLRLHEIRKSRSQNRYKNIADSNFTRLLPTLAENSLLTSGPVAHTEKLIKPLFRGPRLAARHLNRRACINILLTFTTVTTWLITLPQQ